MVPSPHDADEEVGMGDAGACVLGTLVGAVSKAPSLNQLAKLNA